MTALSDCYCDFNPPEFYLARTIMARKPRKCCECREMIRPGERYELVTGKWDGVVATFATCVDCREAWSIAGCECRQHGGLQELLYAAGGGEAARVLAMISAVAEARAVDWAAYVKNKKGACS